MSDGKQLGAMIRFHRRKARLTQGALAELSGVGKTVIFDIEKGKLSIRFDTLLKVLQVVNIQISWQSPLMELFTEELREKG